MSEYNFRDVMVAVAKSILLRHEARLLAKAFPEIEPTKLLQDLE